MRPKNAAVPVVALGLGLALSGAVLGLRTAHAEPTPQELATARALFDDAVELEKNKDYAGALGMFRKVATIKSTGIVRYHEGFCAEKLGRWVEALDAYSRAAIEAQGDPKQKQALEAAKKADVALRPRVPRLRVKVSMPRKAKYELRIDGTVIAPSLADTPILVDPGKHVVEVTSDGLVAKPHEVTVSEKELKDVPVELEEPGKPTPDPPKKDPDPPKKDPPKVEPKPDPKPTAEPIVGRALILGLHLGNASPGGRLFDASDAGKDAKAQRFASGEGGTDQANYVGFGLAVEVDVGVRVLPALSVFLLGQFASLSASGVGKEQDAKASTRALGLGVSLASPRFAKSFAVFGELAVARRWLGIDLASTGTKGSFAGLEPRLRLGLDYRVLPTLSLVAAGWLSFGSYGAPTLEDASGSAEVDLASASHTFVGASLGVVWDAVVFERVSPTWP